MALSVFRTCSFWIGLSMMVITQSASAGPPRLLHKGPIAVDLLAKLEWMRCSVGQFWQDETCQGEALKLVLAQVPEVVARFETLDEGGWRLPTRDELESLVYENDMPPMIKVETFPETVAEAYWTSESNFFNAKNHWVVNFYTGYSYGRVFPNQPQHVRLVRNSRPVTF
ncbi:MAG: DUF1566 domain-containing protein, partial [Paracoccaceae bacterium]|nr:DUF1566 domain-containing protein [Paracoccaceae bacterium]